MGESDMQDYRLDQVRFEREWTALRAYASQRGVRLFGDIAIYVSPGGADEHRKMPCSLPSC